MTNNLDFFHPELFSHAFKYAPIGMAIVSTEGNWLQINSSLSKIIGYSQTELVGKSVEDITHPEDLHKVSEIRNQFLNGKLECYQMEKRYIHKNGFTVWVLLAFSIMRDENQKPLYFISQIQDITENRIAEQELQAKTQQLESFIEHNADAIWLVDLQDTVQEVNPAFTRLFGWSAGEVEGKPLPLIPSFLLTEMHEIHQRIRSGETVIGLQTIRQCKDGRLLDVEATLSPLRDRRGMIIGITGICRDITARKRAEQELQAKTQQLESFIEHNADAIWLVDLEDTILEVNPAFERLFGWSLREVAGKPLPLIPPFLIAEMHEIHQRIKAGETVIGLQTIRQCKDGRLLDVEATLSPLRDRRGLIIGITGICRDVTARKRAEEELNAKTEQLESFIENNADAILIFNNNCLVQRVNETFEYIFGWSKEEIIGMELHSLPYVPAQYLDEAQDIYQQVKNGKSIIGMETVRKRKNGDFLNVVLTAYPIFDGKGNKSGWSVILRDITEWKIAQAQLQNSEKLTVAGQLAAGIAHEIRNPITSIKGFIQLMKAGFAEKQKYYDIMNSEIERIELILSELLILAKPQSIKYERKDIRVLLSQVMTLLDSQAILNNVQFATEFRPGITHLFCDENQLKQVFINFIKNSIESMHSGGTITIKVNSNQNQEMLISIVDQGCGIPKEVLSKLGQPFYTTKEKGTGLGFMVSKKIIENHSGNIKVTSEVNKGTTIEITLPVSS